MITKILLSAFLFILYACNSGTTYQGPVNDPLVKTDSAANLISILTYNVKAIVEKDSSASNELIRYVNKQLFDFVIFQELFSENSRTYLNSRIDSLFYKQRIPRIDYESFPQNIFQDSGLFFLSHYPQISLDTIDFGPEISQSNGYVYAPLKKEISITMDFIVNKSIMGSLHRLKDGNLVFLFATHLQAIGSETHKQIQLLQIRSFIEYTIRKAIQSGIILNPENCIVLLSGDFNLDAYENLTYLSLLENLGNPRDLHKEFHKENKEYSIIFKGINMQKRFDYIFAYDKLGIYTFKKVSVQSINITDVQDRQNNSISDHFAMKATLRY